MPNYPDKLIDSIENGEIIITGMAIVYELTRKLENTTEWPTRVKQMEFRMLPKATREMILHEVFNVVINLADDS